MTEIERQIGVIKRGTVEIIEEADLRRKLERSLASNTPLRVKYGIDPTAPEIHLGHTVPIRKLRDFQELGHRILFLIGDFTARIGDPTGRKETRPTLTVPEIERNLARYREQAGKVLDLDRTEFVTNSTWLSPLTLEEIIRLMSVFTVAQVLEREDFTVRYRERKPISLHEFLYPLLQGYDSVALDADVEIGATEQKFNLLAGRTIQEAFGREKQAVITMPILVGTDGTLKMSKTYGNHIPVTADADDMFGRVMSVADAVMEDYFALLTSVAQDEYRARIAAGPRDAKAFLAREIVAGYFGAERAAAAEAEFDRVFRSRGAPSEMPAFRIPAEMREPGGTASVLKVICTAGLAPTNSEGRRLIVQKAVEVAGEIVADPNAKHAFPVGAVVRVGKRRFVRIEA